MRCFLRAVSRQVADHAARPASAAARLRGDELAGGERRALVVHRGRGATQPVARDDAVLVLAEHVLHVGDRAGQRGAGLPNAGSTASFA